MDLKRITSSNFIFFVLLSSILVGCSVEIDPSVANTAFGMQVLHYEFIIVLLSLLGGIGCLIAGIILTILGFSGSIEWIVEISGFTSRLVNASPGIVLIIAGLLLVLKSRLEIVVKIKKRN